MFQNASKNVARRAAAALAVSAALAMGLAGCASTADSEVDDAVQAESAADDAASGDVYTGEVTFGGVTVDVPEGWTAMVNGDSLVMEAPEGGADDANAQGGIYYGGVGDADEQEAVSAYVDGIQQALSEQQGFEGTSEEVQIDGHAAKTAKCSLSSEGNTVEVYTVAVAANGNIVTLMMASSEGDYNAEFESIIDSITIG